MKNKELLKIKLAEMNKKDKNWNWSGKLTEDGAVINWTYLDYVGEGDSPFTIEKADYKFKDEYVAYEPYGEIIEIGTFEQCIESVYHNARTCW